MTQYALIAIAGIISSAVYVWFPLSISVIFLFLLWVVYKKSPKKRQVLKLIFVFAVFFAWSLYIGTQDSELINTDAYIEGTVQDVPERYNQKIRFTLNVERINREEVQGQVIATGSENLSVSSGDTVLARVRLKRLVPLRNSQASCNRMQHERGQVFAFIQALVVTGQDRGWRSRLNQVREGLKKAIDNSLERDSSDFVQAIVLGLQRQIRPQVREAFIESGVAHILSISGTHFGLLALVVFALVRRLTLLLSERVLIRLTLYVTPSQVAAIVTFIVLVFYLGISGWQVPAFRSFVMFGVYLLSIFFTRKNQIMNALAFAALIIVVLQPEALFSLSFQLSFLAVLFIALGIQRFYPDQQNRGQRAAQKLKGMLLVTLFATAGTAPLVARAFHQFSIVSFAANLVISPLVCFLLLPLAFVSSLIVVLFNLTALPLSSVIQVLAKLVLLVTDFLASLPLSSLPVRGPSMFIIFLYYAGLIVVMKYNSLWRFVPVAVAAAGYIVTPFLIGSQASVTFLDVGQGDSAVVSLPDGRVLLVDGGVRQGDSGQSAVVSYLWDSGIRNIDFMALSHGHPDHFGGLLDVMDRFKVQEIWYNGRATVESEPFYTKALSKGIKLRVLKRGSLIEGQNYQVMALHPYDMFYSNGYVNLQENNESLVFILKLYGTAILFTGDIEAEAEWDLVHLGKWLQCDIIKVPHHGGRTSSTPDLLERARPKVAIISVGAKNQFAHPHKETLLQYSQAQVYRTDRDGAIIVHIDKNGYKVRTCSDYSLKEVKNIRDEFRNFRLLFYQ